MPRRPIAYHITCGTYGTRPHGDERGTVDRAMNQPGDPIIGADPAWWERERNKLKFDRVILSPAQMTFAEQTTDTVRLSPRCAARAGALSRATVSVSERSNENADHARTPDKEACRSSPRS